MATAPIGIAPVLTPKTISLLASSLDEKNLGDIAALFRTLHPFAHGLVDKFHVPLLKNGRAGEFTKRFKSLARDYEPYRLYLNFRVVSAFGAEQFAPVYLDILKSLVGRFSDEARRLDLEPELLSALLQDYVLIISTLQKTVPSQQSASLESPVEQFSVMVELFHRATRFDFAFTSIFLILEGTVSPPAALVKIALLKACQRSLSEFAEGLITCLGSVHEADDWALKSSHFKIPASEKVFQVIEGGKFGERPLTSRFLPSRRTDEVDWLAKNVKLSDDYRGKWLVIEKNELIASDADYLKARAIAKARGIRRPFIIYVPVSESESFMGI
jgi:hypothetical protein